MQETYKKNHTGVEVQGDVCAADYADIVRRYGKIDVVIGGLHVRAFQMQIVKKPCNQPKQQACKAVFKGHFRTSAQSLCDGKRKHA